VSGFVLWLVAVAYSFGSVSPREAAAKPLLVHREPDIDATSEVLSTSWSPDGTFIATASADKLVRIFRADSAELMHEVRLAARLLAVVHGYRPLGLQLHGHTSLVNSVAFSPDGLRLVSGSFDGTARIWFVANGACEHVLTGHTAEIHAVAYSRGGALSLAICGGTVHPSCAGAADVCAIMSEAACRCACGVGVDRQDHPHLGGAVRNAWVVRAGRRAGGRARLRMGACGAMCARLQIAASACGTVVMTARVCVDGCT
jgi:hypothetical protein